MIVAGNEGDQLEPVGWQRRHVALNVMHRLEACQVNLRLGTQRDDQTAALTASERNFHTASDIGSRRI